MSRRRWCTGLLGVGLAVVTAGGCSSGPARPAAPGTPPEPQTFQAESVARQEFGLLAGGGWAQAWSLWDDSGQQAITQADFVKLNTECRPALGVPYVIDESGKVAEDTVRVAWHQGAERGSNTLVFTRGTWRFVPDATSLTAYRTGVDQLVAARRAAGSCH
ncbi:hypothetical protein ACFZB9_22070 [Kitasatospora sp. NPDC008050]|uniref:hypothetical protein n=1 Tax=Kitasatospora sp. NPDC008050 TaxID=3364021 RepID=UPI0036E737F7